jgi:hypothetical protein
MASPSYLDQIRSFVDDVLLRDGHDLESVKRALGEKAPEPGVERVPGAAPRTESETLEAIISQHRPVFAIADDKVDPQLTVNETDAEDTAMLDLVKGNAATINGLVRSIGRIDLPGDENYPWVGTGWVIDSELGNDIVITNAHVARLFAESAAAGFAFTTLPFLSRKEQPIVDFRHEIKGTPARPFDVKEVIYIGTPGFLDVAFLRVARNGADGALSGPIKLAKDDPAANIPVATIGYPGTDRGHYDLETLIRIFGNVFDTKRLAPGKVIGPDDRGLSHDCSTMPGSSGSILFNPKTGEAVGLHFQGVPFKSNHAVPASVIRKLIKDRPWQSGRAQNVDTTSGGPSPNESGKRKRSGIMSGSNSDGARIDAVVDANGVRVTVPLEITVRFGGGPAAGAGRAAAQPQPRKVDRASAEAAVATVKSAVQTNKDVLGIRATYLFEDGRLSDEVGVVLKVRPEASRDPRDYGLETSVNGVPLSIEMADLESLARALVPGGLEAPARMQAYERDITNAKFRLDPVTDDMRIVLHVSPEAGWRVLSKFFTGDDYNQITIGMYNFTAPHIIEAVRAAIKPNSRQMVMTIDRKSDDIGGSGLKADDWPEEKLLKTLERDADARFKWAPASVSGRGRLFATSYHIKVAVLGDRAGPNKRFWLSSGNWASTNQPALDDQDNPLEDLTWADVKAGDRDWHAVVENEKLATVFRNHLAQDYVDCEKIAGEEAAAPVLPDLIVPDDYFLEAPRTVRNYKAFAPKVITGRITVQPVLTPDNYPEVVQPLIEGARQSVLFINQSFDIKENQDDIPEHYRGLLDALLERQKKGLDVRIIFRSGYGKEGDIFRNAVEFGFDKKRIRFYGTCHTKGIVVDSKRVLLGSQNWTGAGTKPNRDASLLIDSEEAAKYFTDIFEFDWENIATDRLAPDHGPTRRARAASGGEEAVVPSGFRIVPWGTWSGS